MGLLFLHQERENPTKGPNYIATVPAEFEPAARGPRPFSFLACRLSCSCCGCSASCSPTLLFSSPLSSPRSPHRPQGMCRVASRGVLVVL